MKSFPKYPTMKGRYWRNSRNQNLRVATSVANWKSLTKWKNLFQILPKRNHSRQQKRMVCPRYVKIINGFHRLSGVFSVICFPYVSLFVFFYPSLFYVNRKKPLLRNLLKNLKALRLAKVKFPPRLMIKIRQFCALLSLNHQRYVLC